MKVTFHRTPFSPTGSTICRKALKTQIYLYLLISDIGNNGGSAELERCIIQVTGEKVCGASVVDLLSGTILPLGTLKRLPSWKLSQESHCLGVFREWNLHPLFSPQGSRVKASMC